MSDSPSLPLEKPLLPRLAKALAFVLVPVLLIAGGWAGFKYAKLHLALRHAHHEFERRQFMRAEFWTGRALGVNGRDVEASRLMAEINEAQDKPVALSWRIRVAQLNPRSTADTIAWAKCAFRFGQREMALNALKSLPPDFQEQSAEYHELMAGCALAVHEPGFAEAHFLKAVELGHDNPVHQVNLEAFRLSNSLSQETRTAATRDLENALHDSRASLFAARALLADAIRSQDHARAQKFAEKLRSIPEHNFDDDLSCLEAVIADPTFHPALGEIEHRAESNPLRIIAAGDWLNSHGMAAETLRWFAELPEPMRSNIRVQMMVAESYPGTRDWNGLETFLAKCHWDDGEFLRHALLVRCKRALSQPWEKEWDQLATEVEGHPPNGFLLAQLVSSWQWRKEALHLLWGAASQPKTNSMALQSLWDLYSQTNETRELLRVARAQIELDPSNPVTKNNAAFLSLLLNGASERSETLAREATTANPNVPEWVATYAYALHLSGKESAAKKVMERLPSEALGRPGIALYYAIVLAASGDHSQARDSLAKLNPHGMLPEEQKLAADLVQQLNVASR